MYGTGEPEKEAERVFGSCDTQSTKLNSPQQKKGKATPKKSARRDGKKTSSSTALMEKES